MRYCIKILLNGRDFMKFKLILIIVLLFSILSIWLYAALITPYYSSSIYNVEIKPSTNELTYSVSDKSQAVAVTLCNHSRKIVSSENNVFLSYHILNQNGDIVSYENVRTRLPLIGPFSDYIVDMLFDVPTEPGLYTLTVDLVEEGVTWFEAKGNYTSRIQLQVN